MNILKKRIFKTNSLKNVNYNTTKFKKFFNYPSRSLLESIKEYIKTIKNV